MSGQQLPKGSGSSMEDAAHRQAIARYADDLERIARYSTQGGAAREEIKNPAQLQPASPYKGAVVEALIKFNESQEQYFQSWRDKIQRMGRSRAAERLRLRRRAISRFLPLLRKTKDQWLAR